MRFKMLSLFAVVGLLSACGTAPTSETASTSGSGTATTAAPAPAASIESTASKIVPGSAEDLKVNVGDMVFFGFDKYNLTAEARNTLQKQAAWLAANSGVRVTIEGHADERGTREYNLALGERRASAVADYLATLGVSPSRITTVSYGKERPLDPASNEIAWAKNRRGVTVVK